MELDRSVLVDGAHIRYSVTGAGTETLVVIHGAGAHHMWFYRMFPELERGWRLISIDFSGHGASDHRTAYSVELWAQEIAAIITAEDAAPAVVVGHSMGARIGVALAAQHPELVSRLVMLDGNVRSPAEYPRPGERPGPRAHRVFANREEAIARFRLVPGQDAPAEDLLTPLAEYSLGQVDGGWTWRHDWNSPTTPYDEYINGCIAKLTMPVTFAYGTASPIVTDAKAQYFVSLAKIDVTIVPIEEGQHHLMLDKPDECIAAISAS
ncbi:MAG: alpha/beta hydrolase [Actinomycetota bacterium]|nr:alpha/beta hydrolase [Actinomycetota bacterium]MDP2288091.1 alpha/beta hydrolase [Actinomycetota bacterium]